MRASRRVRGAAAVRRIVRTALHLSDMGVRGRACEGSFVSTSSDKMCCASAGAAAISGKPLQRVEVHGKNLFYFWGHDERLATVDLRGPQPPEGLQDAVILHGEAHSVRHGAPIIISS